MFLTTLLQQRKYRSNFSVFSAKAKTFPQCGKIFGALFMTLIITKLKLKKFLKKKIRSGTKQIRIRNSNEADRQQFV